ncbi:DUF1365 domain-containing protein [Endozoicomonas sp. Mp262]|uniref:DUF1365 domain-containing protein n=1 Tax=Endozoicomonas sp. Mp262 TaxID=2919499 RepID=UPI0021DA24AB
MKHSCLYLASVMHQRIRPRRHGFRYGVTSWLVDLDELDELAGQLRLFSRNRFNLLSFYDRDYGDRSGSDLKAQVIALLQDKGVSKPDRVSLLCFPRVFGYVFNPLSIYFCYRPDGSISAILHEVSNTFGERHTYIIPCNGHYRERDIIRQRAGKEMHVSPFMAMDYQYGFRIKPPGEQLLVGITMADTKGLMFSAVLKGNRKPLTDWGLTAQLATMPLMTVKITVGILWEATRLYIKGLKIFKHKPAKKAVSSSYGVTVE